jgi:hypothetical protein
MRTDVWLQVQTPVVEDKPEWGLNGQVIIVTITTNFILNITSNIILTITTNITQVLSISLGLTETVASIKTRIMEELGMPQGKQKLQHENIFFKVQHCHTIYRNHRRCLPLPPSRTPTLWPTTTCARAPWCSSSSRSVVGGRNEMAASSARLRI